MKGLDTSYHEEDINNGCLTIGCPNEFSIENKGYCSECQIVLNSLNEVLKKKISNKKKSKIILNALQEMLNNIERKGVF